MFTIEDICDIAIQIERNGEAAYAQAAQNAADAGVKALLYRMADDERRHAQWFEAMALKQNRKSPQPEMEAMGRSLLQEMVKGQTFSLKSSTLSKTDAIKALLKQSIGFEKDTIAFYEMLFEFVEDQQVQKQLGLIIEEEQQHMVLLSQMYETALL